MIAAITETRSKDGKVLLAISCRHRGASLYELSMDLGAKPTKAQRATARAHLQRAWVKHRAEKH